MCCCKQPQQQQHDRAERVALFLSPRSASAIKEQGPRGSRGEDLPSLNRCCCGRPICGCGLLVPQQAQMRTIPVSQLGLVLSALNHFIVRLNYAAHMSEIVVLSMSRKVGTLRVPLGRWKRTLCGRLAQNFRGRSGLMCGCHSCWKISCYYESAGEA